LQEYREEGPYQQQLVEVMVSSSGFSHKHDSMTRSYQLRHRQHNHWYVMMLVTDSL
jgi:hypothetical protein